jgi:hypothetical protein
MTMTKFEDQLFTDLMQEYRPVLQRIQRPAATGRRAVPRPAWLAAAAAGIAGVATVSVLLSGGSPAYAVTQNAGGTVTISVSRPAGVAGANARLHALADQVVLVPVRPGCPAISSLPAASWPPTARPITGTMTKAADGTVTVSARGIPSGDTMLIPVLTRPDGIMYLTPHLIKGPAPSCVSLPSGNAVP